MSYSLRAIVIDDEPLAREGLRLRLGWLPNVTVVAECATAADAIETCARVESDIVFVDVQMPQLDGFGVIERLERDLLPVVIFVTAHGEHALRAFRVGAFDYLLKPFDDRTLGESVERARVFVSLVRAERSRGNDEPADAIESLERLTVRDDGKVIFLDPAEIDWVEAAGDNVRIHVAAKVYLLRTTMQAMEQRLDASRFVRVHRGAIVALPLIRELQPYSRGEHLVVLTDGTKLPLSRRVKPRITEALARR